jgi:hypothetical protein
MLRKTKTNSKSKRYRAKSRRCRRGGAPPSAEDVRAALSALEKLEVECNPADILKGQNLIGIIKKGIYMDALNQGSAASFTSSAVSGPEPVTSGTFTYSRPTHEVDPSEYEPVSRPPRHAPIRYDVNSPWN